MKIGFCADIHLGCTGLGFSSQPGTHTHVEDTAKCLDVFVDALVDQKVQDLFILGDVFHTRTPSPQAQFLFGQACEKFLEQDGYIYIVLGNHDYFKSFSSMAMLEGLNHKHIRIISEPRLIKFEDAKVLTIPWPSIKAKKPSDFEDYIESVIEKHKSATIIGAHLPIMTAMVGAYQRTGVETGVQSHKFFKIPTFLGHYHCWQQLSDNVMYCGSINRVDFSEIEENKYGIIYDTEKDSVEKIDMPATRIAQINTTPKDLEQDLEKAKLKGAVVKIVLACDNYADAPLVNDVETILKAKGIRHLNGYDVQVESEVAQSKIKDLNVDPIAALRQWLEPLKLDEDEFARTIEEGKEIVTA